MRIILPLALSIACALPAAADTLSGSKAFGDWRNDRPGTVRLIRPADLPAPGETPVVANVSGIVPRPEGGKPRVPAGFDVQLVASDLSGPRTLRAAPNGDIFIAESAAGRIGVLTADAPRDGSAKTPIFADGLNRPYGVAFYPPGAEPRFVYVAETGRVVRFPYRTGDLKPSGPAEVVIDSLPGGGSHWTRDIAFSPDGKQLFISIGSRSNAGEGMGDAPPGRLADWEAQHGVGAGWGGETGRAAVLVADPDGGNLRPFATGVRNCSGLAIEPASGAPWCAVNERDGLGDNLPPDYATRVEAGGFYGWPWFYTGGNPDPRHAGEREDLRERAIVPDVLFQPHSAPLGMAFHDGKTFPPDYAGNAFVALHGSWNRGRLTGYKVVRLLFEQGKPTGAYEDFMTGFVLSGNAVWGRPVGITVGKDGALYVSEDGNGTIWRVAPS